MKKLLLCLCLLLTLPACAGSRRPDQQALDFRTKLLEAGGCSFRAELTADEGERLFPFTVQCTWRTDGTAELEVLAPEAIAGIRASMTRQGAALEYDGSRLELGTLAGGRLSPMEGPWLLGACWTSAYISAAGAEGELERISYLHGYGAEELRLDTWLNEAGVPLGAELYADGQRCLTVNLSEFAFLKA